MPIDNSFLAALGSSEMSLRIPGARSLDPSRILASETTSRASRAITPTRSVISPILEIPSTGTEPCGKVRPNNPFKLAGNTLEPPVSVPMPRGAKPAAIPTAGPTDEPPHHCSVDQQVVHHTAI